LPIGAPLLLCTLNATRDARCSDWPAGFETSEIFLVVQRFTTGLQSSTQDFLAYLSPSIPRRQEGIHAGGSR